ncbi:MAG: histidine kinase [Bacteroidetes bacterium GWC2_33_15]|nr:MAG: histidine kinase [Bacteroidetes bacterium GWA2_33_15]OFX49622.1 MAG: histidine kinase [Bacteroidetes bacterium GWC2_33_15]OFX66320.1 MAG: histidine kinase [Bacteroidetes bacterium GWB2_32_14]OFX70109.1 MAG: histidine kinase [Bacteroidetes bacterium GWD2_33_33]
MILSLSNEIAKLDESEIRFSIDAGIINRLGKELVGRHETAVSELVKNSYDADATEVILTFENAWQKGGILTIDDDGHGMTREQLINGFMRLSSADKIHNPISPKYNRTRAGKKGIGRFATQRLGEKLTIITQTINSDKAIKLSIDWNVFETDKDLSIIANRIEFVEKLREEGTSLIIDNLREGWSDAMIKRVFRYTSDLLQPFPLSKKRIEQEKDRIDPGFKSSYNRKEGNELTKIIDEEEAFLNHALAEIEGYVMDDGQGCWALKSDKLDFPQDVFLIGSDKDDKDNLEAKYLYIKGLHFKVYYFIYFEPNLIPPQTMTFIREVANEKGGIRVYRNGFRVLPYGEKLNDWLGLDESSGKRVILVPHRNINFFGFVEISDNTSNLFDETSSREGLFRNEAFDEMVDFVQRSIISAVFKVSELRGRKGRTAQKDWTKKEKTPTEKVDNAIDTIKEVFEDSSTKEEFEDSSKEKSYYKKEKFDKAFRQLIEGRIEEKKEKKDLIDELNMMRILAGLGLVIGEFVHEIKNYFPGIDAEMNFLRNALKDYKEGLERVNNLENNVKSLTTYSSYFDEAISRNVLRELEPIELRDVVYRFEEVIQNNLERTKITLEKPIFNGFDLFTIPMHPSEWASILFNFYTNSKKAIRREGSSGKILIKCGRENGNVYLEFSDNGDGIPKDKEEIIFNAFYTTSSAAGHSASEIDSLTGTGLGLKIIKDIIESYNGNIFVSTPEEGYKTTIRVEVPENKSE